jgi:hypothetical protein
LAGDSVLRKVLFDFRSVPFAGLGLVFVFCVAARCAMPKCIIDSSEQSVASGDEGYTYCAVAVTPAANIYDNAAFNFVVGEDMCGF